jgi:cytochrome b561
MRSVHWITLSLLVSVYTLAWSIDSGASRDEAQWLVMMHRSLGLSVLLLTLFRMIWRRTTPMPSLPNNMPLLQRLAAQAVTAALYVLLVLQPLLGLVASQAHGDRITVFGIFALPSVIETNRSLAHQIFALHGTVAIVLLTLIGMHACAALYHHVMRRDQVLAGMLPGVPLLPLSAEGELDNVPQ